MILHRIVSLPAFTVVGRSTWIGGQDNDLFGRFWEQSRADGLLADLRRIQSQTGLPAGPRTQGAVLGISRVEADPANRAFDYMIAVEVPGSFTAALPASLEVYEVPAARWAVFDCIGLVPEALVAAEMYAFTEWLPASGYRHAFAPEMEVYPPVQGPKSCEFWLPIE